MSIKLEPASQEFLQSLARGLLVIRAFGAEKPRMSLAELARKTGLPRAAVRRCLLTLIKLGYAELNGQSFQLRPRVLDLGYAYLSSLNFWDGIQPVLERLVVEVGESCSVSVLDGEEIVYVARVPVKRIISPTVSIGTRLPAFATAMGQVLLGGLSGEALDAYLISARLPKYTPKTLTDASALRERIATVKAEGFAFVYEELERGLVSLAVPLCDRHGNIVAALGESAHSTRISSQDMIKKHLPLLKAAADEAALIVR